jgi:hypothetical protein
MTKYEKIEPVAELEKVRVKELEVGDSFIYFGKEFVVRGKDESWIYFVGNKIPQQLGKNCQMYVMKILKPKAPPVVEVKSIVEVVANFMDEPVTINNIIAEFKFSRIYVHDILKRIRDRYVVDIKPITKAVKTYQVLSKKEVKRRKTIAQVNKDLVAFLNWKSRDIATNEPEPQGEALNQSYG